MPLFIAALWGALLQLLGTLVGRVLVSLGIGYVSYTAVDTSIGYVKTFFVNSLTGLPADALGIMSALKVGTCVSMLASALLMRLTLAGLASGTLKKMVIK